MKQLKDINECATKEGNECEMACINQVGSYECECENGYELAEDGFKCKETCNKLRR